MIRACSLDDLAAHADGLILLSGGALAGFIGAPAGDGRPAWRVRAPISLRPCSVIGFISNCNVMALAWNGRQNRIY